jgi:hypothetical protein
MVTSYPRLMSFLMALFLAFDRVQTGEVVSAGVVVAFAVGEHVPGCGEDGMFQRDDGFIGPRRAGCGGI